MPVRRRHDGWTAERQHAFIKAIAETGCVLIAARSVGMTARSAYRLAARPDAIAFARAWQAALFVATPRLSSVAFDFVINGMRETVWKDGVCVYERRRPSEKLLMFLLSRLAPEVYGRPVRSEDGSDMRETCARLLPRYLDDLQDLPPEPGETDGLGSDDDEGDRPDADGFGPEGERP